MRRAIREEQKLARRQEILETAWVLFQEQDYEQVNMIDVAQGAGLAKGTVYLYFKTKEELFLAMLSEQFEQWFNEIDGRLQTDVQLSTAPALADMLTDSLVKRPLLTRLFTLLHPILERNINPEAALPFKLMLLTRLTHTGSLLESRLPFLQPGQGAQLQMQIYAIILGLQQMANPAPVVCSLVAQHPDLAAMTIDFAPTFKATITTLIYGLEKQREERGA
jgi:AcrR family transcriptional regulator